MKKYFYILILSTLPYSASLTGVGAPEQDSLPPLAFTLYPTLHEMSGYAVGVHKDYTLVFGGVIHEGAPELQNTYPNMEIILIDYRRRRASAFTTGSFKGILGEQLAARGMAYFQDGSTLYLIGGYGYSETHGRFLTFPYLTTIDLPATIEALNRGAPPVGAVHQLCDDRLAIFDGTMDYNQDEFFLLNGRKAQKLHPFEDDSEYMEETREGQVRTFRLSGEGSSLQINQFRTWYDLQAFEEYYQGTLPPKIAIAVEKWRQSQLED